MAVVKYVQERGRFPEKKLESLITQDKEDSRNVKECGWLWVLVPPVSIQYWTMKRLQNISSVDKNYTVNPK